MSPHPTTRANDCVAQFKIEGGADTVCIGVRPPVQSKTENPSLDHGLNSAILLALYSVNHRLPSEPAAMFEGPLAGVRIGYSVITPFGVILPILLAAFSVNHRLPSDPVTILVGTLLAVGVRKCVTFPVGVIRPIALGPELQKFASVNQMFPSGPATMPSGLLPPPKDSPPVENVMITPASVTLRIV